MGNKVSTEKDHVSSSEDEDDSSKQNDTSRRDSTGSGIVSYTPGEEKTANGHTNKAFDKM